MCTYSPAKTLEFYLKKVDIAVEKAIEENPNAEITLLAHSIGGDDLYFIFMTGNQILCIEKHLIQAMTDIITYAFSNVRKSTRVYLCCMV